MPDYSSAWPRLFRNRHDRLIAAGRVVLAVFSLIAIKLDPSEPARFSGGTYFILLIYVAYALIEASLAFRATQPRPKWDLFTHVADLTIFTILMYLTEGPTSPFFVLFTFSLLSATLRWQWRGVLWTTIAVLVIFLVFGVTLAGVEPASAFDLNRIIIRAAYIAVAAAMLGYVGVHQDAIRKDLWKLAAWPGAFPATANGFVKSILDHTSNVFGTRRAVLAWHYVDDPWLRLSWDLDGKSGSSCEPPGRYNPLLADSLSRFGFFCLDITTPDPLTYFGGADQLYSRRGTVLNPEFAERFQIKTVLSIPLSGQRVKARLFILDKAGLTSDDLIIGDLLAHEATARLDQADLLGRLREAAASEERVRVARDLHDGVLQSLAGTALQLDSVRRVVSSNPQAAERRLGEILRAIAAEQADLRSFIHQLKPRHVVSQDVELGLAEQLGALGQRLGRQWKLDVRCSVDPPDTRLPAPLCYEIYRMVSEGVANAARHGGASQIEVESRSVRDGLYLAICDNGCGFPFQGHYDHATLKARNLGPLNLRERIASIGGQLAIDSGPAGSRLEISLPLVIERAAHAD